MSLSHYSLSLTRHLPLPVPPIYLSITPPQSFDTTPLASAAYTWQLVPSLGLQASGSYMLTNLLPGATYYARVSAVTVRGVGARRLAAPNAFTVPITPPSAPTQVPYYQQHYHHHHHHHHHQHHQRVIYTFSHSSHYPYLPTPLLTPTHYSDYHNHTTPHHVQREGSWGLPRLFLSSPTSLTVRIGHPSFDGGSLAAQVFE